MLDQPSSPPKPVTEVWRPDLVFLPKLTFSRRVFRVCLRGITKLLTFLLLRAEVSGLENFPRHGPAIIVFNHLGDTDAVLMMATLPFKSPVEGIGKIELNEHWLVGPVFRTHGIIWVHRGQPDRRALRAALAAIEWPEDELSVFATLRGSLFAIGDEELLEYRHRVGRFHPFRIPNEFPTNLAAIVDGLKLLQALHRRRSPRAVRR